MNMPSSDFFVSLMLKSQPTHQVELDQLKNTKQKARDWVEQQNLISFVEMTLKWTVLHSAYKTTILRLSWQWSHLSKEFTMLKICKRFY